MRWPWSSESSEQRRDASTSQEPEVCPTCASPTSPRRRSSWLAWWRGEEPLSWNDSLNKTDWQHYLEPRQLAPTLIATCTLVGLLHLYRAYFRRFPGTDHISPNFFRKRSLLGRVTSVGDGDNFRLFHTPGGRLAGWGWLRKVPKNKKELQGRTIPIRIAGVDAPEGAHFGRPAQPFSGEALSFLTSYLLGRKVRAYIYRRDQYERVVGTVYVRKWLFFRKDVGLEMLKRGLATTYEAKTGSEFGGLEAKYRAAEEKAKRSKRGMWSQLKGTLETPREYKNRVTAAEEKAKKKP